MKNCLDADRLFIPNSRCHGQGETISNGMDSIFYDGELSKVQAIQKVVAMVQSVLILECLVIWIFYILNYQVGEEELDDGKKVLHVMQHQFLVWRG